MRLTLRTLLAWLDDTLQPHEVREIGRQVAESPYARELSERIHRVTRQRRLTVPGRSGPEGSDPNVVAAYLDNDLDPEEVADFEKRCLTSDVNLAEVASVHQILSLLGQKVKVPAEARHRMYQLGKGREAVAKRRPMPRRRPEPKEPVTRPIQPWALPEPPRQPWIERYGPAIAILLLIGIAIEAARESLSVPPHAPMNVPVAVQPEPEPEAAAPNPAPVVPPVAVVVPSPAPEPAMPKADVAKAKPVEPTPPPPSVPDDVAAIAEKPDGILLRYDDDTREWERIAKQAKLRTSDLVLGLEPFRSSIDIGKVRLNLIHETEVRILSKPSAPVPAFELVRGRVAIRQPGADRLKVGYAGRSITLELAPDCVVGLERYSRHQRGEPITRPASLGVICQQGQVTVVAGDRRETLSPGGTALLEPDGSIQTGQNPDAPPWLARSQPSEFENQVRDQFFKLFHADRPVLAEVVAAIEDDRELIKPLAVTALKALGDLSLLMPNLSRPNDPTVRRSAIYAVRSYMLTGPEAYARVRSALDEEFGADVGGFALRMLTGFSPQEVRDPDLLNRLVSTLGPAKDSVGLRELALDNLKFITGRDDLGYDPDHPEGKGLDAWAELLRHGELKPMNESAPPRPASRSSKKSRS